MEWLSQKPLSRSQPLSAHSTPKMIRRCEFLGHSTADTVMVIRFFGHLAARVSLRTSSESEIWASLEVRGCDTNLRSLIQFMWALRAESLIQFKGQLDDHYK